jgi:hypothetical protein
MDLEDLLKESKNGKSISRWQVLLSLAPIYVTNETAGGMITKYSAPMILNLSVIFLLLVNAFGWGIYGIVELFGKIF